MDIATREAYGKKLAELGEKHAHIVVLDADLSCSTQTKYFAKKFPSRFFNMGVAEQDLMGTAAGLAACGKIPFVSTFAIFATGRAWEVVRQSIVYPGLNVKICASHAGLTVGEDGASHQTIEDIALMRVLPGMKVFVPADAQETEQILETVVTLPGPVYIRLGRAKCPPVFDSNYRFEVGKGTVLREGGDVCLLTAGFMTSIVLEAANRLSQKGVQAAVVAMASIKPIDTALIIRMAKTHPLMVSIEEHSIIGGLGSAVAEVLAESSITPLLRLGVNDEFGQSGSYKEVLAHYGLSAEGLTKNILSRIKK